MKNTHKVQVQKPQQGVVLITGLIFLLVLTILGISAVSVNTQQERMAGNARDRNLAFQAAEAALREGDIYVNQSIGAVLFKKTCPNGLCKPNVNTTSGKPVWQAYTDSDTGGFMADKSRGLGSIYGAAASNYEIRGVANQPRYMVEDLGKILPLDGNQAQGSAYDVNSSYYLYYRVSAAGSGRNTNTQVQIQHITRRK